MQSVIDLKFFKKYIKDKEIIMFFGNNNLDQYNSATEVKNIIKYINKNMEKNAILLHFGELHKDGQLDLGYIFKEIASKRKDIEIISILQSELKEQINIPEYVSKVFWHNNYYSKNKQKTRGISINNGTKKPVAGTKIWYELNKIKQITRIYLIGGSEYYFEEYNLAKDLDIEIEYYPIKRKYKGDGITLIKKNASKEDKYGLTIEIDCENEDKDE